MKNTHILFYSLAACITSARADWDTRTVQIEKGADSYVMIYRSDSERGTKSISTELDALSRTGKITKLRTLSIHALVDDDTFQKEIFEQLEKIAPAVLNAAKKSKGDMHNPQMKALHPYFSKAIMETPTATKFGQVLAKHGLKISEPSFEKLILLRRDKTEKLKCFLWLSIESLN